MARAFQPTVSYDEGYDSKNFSVPTYAEVKRKMKEYLAKANGIVSVYRHRRGEWGEWFEHWELQQGQPVIIKEGWQ